MNLTFFKSRTAISDFVLILISAICYALSFPPFNLSFLAWIIFIPIFYILLSESNKTAIFIRLYLWLVLIHLFIVYWISLSTIGGGVLTTLFNALFMTTPVVIYLLMAHDLQSDIIKLSIFSLLWIAFEYFLSQWELAFPWLILGNSQYLFSYVMQWASIGGAWILTFLILIINLLGFIVLRNYFKTNMIYRRQFLILFIFIAFVFSLGFYLKNESLHIISEATIGIVQPNIDPWNKWEQEKEVDNFDQLIKQSQLLCNTEPKPDIIVWPETAVPFYLMNNGSSVFYDNLVRFSITNQLAIATGFPNIVLYNDSTEAPPSARYSEWRYKYYQHFNSSLLIDRNLTPTAYNKINLVPFAERVPWIDLYPKFKDTRFNLAGLGGWGKGKDTINFQLKEKPNMIFPTAICFESAFPDLIKIFTEKGATFISIITNDGWWGTSGGYQQHFQFSRLRAIENRRWVVRSANNGLSGFINPFGDVVSRSEFWTKTEMKDNIQLISDISFFVRFGNWLPYFAFILAVVLTIYSKIKSL